MKCSNCGAEAPTTQQEGRYIDWGWSLSHNFLGHYGGFSDNFPSEGLLSHICHDCCVVMMRALPGLAKSLFPAGGGGHPSVSNETGILTPSCCEYAWTWDKEERCGECGDHVLYFGAPDGGWRRQECCRQQEAPEQG